MIKKPIFLLCQPSDVYFQWQIELFLDNNIELGVDNETHVLWFLPYDRLEQGWEPTLLTLQEKYKNKGNIRFFFFEDTKDILNNDIRKINYIPLLRPYCLKEHFKNNPELSKETFFYCDSDILLLNNLPFDKFNDENTCYLSYTGARYKGGNYLDLDYLIGKESQCIPEMQEMLKELNVPARLAEFCGITREIVELNDNGTGGAQYYLKNIDAQFWQDVYDSCIKIRPFLQKINQQAFLGNNPNEKENNGYQSFCTDMWAVLYNIWKRNMKTECPKELDFAWATDPIDKLGTVSILHNAGVSSNIMNMEGVDSFMFYKGLYANNDRIPYLEPFNLKLVTPKYCTFFYAQMLLKLKDKGIFNKNN